MAAQCLSMHAGYRCRHAGACCRSGWTIPVEPPAARALTAHFGADRGQLFDRIGSPAGPAVLATRQSGACVLYDESDRLCAGHRDLGESRLPSCCRHFPRVILRDRRGLFVTLSHFCPTAAATLFDPSPLRIVPAPPALTLDDTAEGLDATDVLPPLLRPGMLVDAPAHDAWEREAVGTLANDAVLPDQALARIRAATAALARWTPAAGPLAAAVAAAFRLQERTDLETPVDPCRDAAAWCDVAATIPGGLDRPQPVVDLRGSGPRVARAWREQASAVRRYLAAKLFASWFSYDAGGLLSAVRGAELAASLLRVELARDTAAGLPATRLQATAAIRAADLLLVHLADHRALAHLIEQTA